MAPGEGTRLVSAGRGREAAHPRYTGYSTDGAHLHAGSDDQGEAHLAGTQHGVNAGEAALGLSLAWTWVF